jgi:hypothetical protein
LRRLPGPAYLDENYGDIHSSKSRGARIGSSHRSSSSMASGPEFQLRSASWWDLSEPGVYRSRPRYADDLPVVRSVGAKVWLQHHSGVDGRARGRPRR